MNTIFKYFNRVIFFLFPIIFIPTITDSFGLGKNISLAVMAFLALLLWVIKLITSKEKTVKTNKLFWLFSVFTIWSGVTFFRLESGARMMSLMSPMGIGTVISLFILFFVWLQVNDKEETKKQFLFLTIAGAITGFVSLIVFLLPASNLPLSIPKTNPLVSIGSNWSLTGSIWAEAALFIFLIFGWLKTLLKKVKEKSELKTYLVEAVAVIFFSLLFLLDIYRIFKAGWTFLDFNSAWVIAAEAFKKNPIFGMGIGNFMEAFNSYRPVSFNLTKNWSTTFTSSSMGILQIWTELGIVGLVLAGYLVAMVMKLKKSNKFGKLALFLAICLFLPLNLMTVFLLIWMLSEGVSENKESKLILNAGENNFNVMPYLVAILVLAGVGFGGYWTTRIFLGDFYMRKSLVAAGKNDGTNTYQLAIKAIGFNPYVASYRRIYAQTNLSIAENLLSKTDVSADDKEKASTLVQQAVREAKAAVALDQKNPIYWYNLAGIYRSLVGYVDSSADWSYQAYQQAIVLDSVNPIYYLDFGGLLYSAKEYESAERAFEQATTAKSDYANAWYNWAYAAKQQNKVSAAVTRLEQALKLVPNESSDYEAAVKELEVWKAELAKTTTQAPEQSAITDQNQKAPEAKKATDLAPPVVTGTATAPVTTPETAPVIEETLAPPATEVTGTMTQQ